MAGLLENSCLPFGTKHPFIHIIVEGNWFTVAFSFYKKSDRIIFQNTLLSLIFIELF